MSQQPRRRSGESDAFGELLRGSVRPTLLAGVGCVLAGLVSGPAAALSAALGATLVVVFFSLTLLAMKRTADLPPTTVMLVVLATYTVKVVGLGLILLLLSGVDSLSGYAVGVTITVCALVWLFFEMRAYRRLRIFTYDPDGAAALPRSPGEDRP